MPLSYSQAERALFVEKSEGAKLVRLEGGRQTISEVGGRALMEIRLLGRDEKKSEQTGNGKINGSESTGSQLFVDGYNGNYAQQMDFNRRGIGRVLRIAHLDGRVVLVSLSTSRERSLEANPDGSVAAKRSFLLGKKMQDENKENPIRRVIPASEGWRIEINDTRIREELEKKKLTGKKLQTEFIKTFNAQFIHGLWGCVWREKLTGVKDKYLKEKMIYTIFLPLVVNSSIFLIIPSFHALGIGLFFDLVGYRFLNSYLEGRDVARKNMSEIFRKYVPEEDFSFTPRARKVDSFVESFMPRVEIDKVIRTFAFLQLKGRKLVREKKE